MERSRHNRKVGRQGERLNKPGRSQEGGGAGRAGREDEHGEGFRVPE